MNCKVIYLFILLFLGTSISAQIQKVEPELLYPFIIGEKETEIGEAADPFGTYTGSLVNSNSYNKFIFWDNPKGRFLIFDMNFNLQKRFADDGVHIGGQTIFIDSSGAFIFKAYSKGFVLKFTPDLKKIYQLENGPLAGTSQLYPVQDYVVGAGLIVDPEGKLVEGDERKTLLEKWREQSIYAKETALREKLFPFLIKNDLIVNGNRLYFDPSTNDDHQMLRNWLNMIDNYYKKNVQKLSDQIKNRDIYILQYDINDNLYLRFYANEYMVLDKTMKVLKHFTSSLACNFISPNGDMINKLDTNILRIKNTWDPITNEEVDAWVKEQQSLITQPAAPTADSTQPGKAVIKKLTPSSTLTEPNDKNAYHPVKAFDNNPDTMWFESVDGPGIGESLEVEFSRLIAANAIVVQPGCFMKAYWEQNNRLKEITIYLDDTKIKASFSDQMKDQVIRLDEITTFSKARFVIDSVYKTAKWDDTPIGDISFLVNDEKVEIDLGEYAGVLKK